MDKIILELTKIILVIIVYIFILLTLGPMIDHAFSTLHKEETNFEILTEIISQLITVTVMWYYLNRVVYFILDKYVNIGGIKKIDSIIGIVSGVMLIGLQSHLHSKLKYITHEHPFRFFEIF